MPGVAAAPDDAFPMPEMDSNGVDRSQIRSMLALSPGQRLRRMEAALDPEGLSTTARAVLARIT